MSSNSVKSLSRHLDFCDFKKDGRRHLGFSKIQNWGHIGMTCSVVYRCAEFG